jgi:hypothetical protein
MSKDQKQNLRNAIREHQRLVTHLQTLEKKLKEVITSLEHARRDIDNIMPMGDPCVLRYGNKTLVLTRDKHGMGPVTISEAAVA